MKIDRQKAQAYIQKSRLLGFCVETITTNNGNNCYVISKTDKEHKVLIPDDVTQIKEPFRDIDLLGNIKIVGGSGLKEVDCLFHTYTPDFIDVLDLTEFETCSLSNSYGMFEFCRAKEIKLGNLNTSNVTNMAQMFIGCVTDTLDLSNLDTSKVRSMNEMFSECVIKSINLSKFNTSNVIDMSRMFMYSSIEELDLSNFDTSKVTDMSQMFQGCRIKRINLSSFDTHNVKRMDSMFNYCIADIESHDEEILKAYRERKE